MRLLVLLFLVLLVNILNASATTLPYSLNDARIASGASITALDGDDWTASAPSLRLSIPAHVPGDLITDLFSAGLVPEPLLDNNFKNGSLWNDHVWIYNRSLLLTAQQLHRINSERGQAGDVLLVFDGIKMPAVIQIAGTEVGRAQAQGERLIFSLRHLQARLPAGRRLQAGAQLLSVIFDPSLPTYGLFSMCTGGWDWAPYSETVSVDNFATFSRGIWKSVYLVDVPWVAITHTAIHTRYSGEFPITPLVEGQHGGFLLQVTVHWWGAQAAQGIVEVRPEWASMRAVATEKVSIVAGVSNYTVSIPVKASEILLWWPVGLGQQHLYNVQVLLRPATGDDLPVVTSMRRTGFRYFALVTGNDTDPAYVWSNRNVSGSDTMGMRFRINGQPFFARGANLIPMDTMEGRFDAIAHRRMVISASEGQMNILRTNAVDFYYPDIFYETADEFGVLIFHDMVNRESWTGQPSDENAYRHNLRRLSHHPAIVIWDGCNECNANQGQITTVLAIVISEDRSRVVWPSCPAPRGWKSGVNRLSSHPDGSPLQPSAGTVGDFEGHGPYLHGSGWPAKNGDPENLDLFDPMLPLQLDPTVATGLTFPNWFTSEYGATGWSSFESVSPTVSVHHWSLHGNASRDNCSGTQWPNVCTGDNVMAERNYPCDNEIIVYFGGTSADLDQAGEAAFKRQLFQCLYAQALVIKGYTQQKRSQNTFGTQIWQLNEIWPTGGWGTIEYGTPGMAGQVRGGRWKPIHHWLRDSVFTDRIIVCGVSSGVGDGLQCFVKNDLYAGFTADVTVTAVSMTDGKRSVIYSETAVNFPAGPGYTYWFVAPAINSSSQVLQATVFDAEAEVVLAHNTILMCPPYKIDLRPVTVQAEVSGKVNADASVDIVLRKQEAAPALFVTLTTLAQGRFSLNAFLMVDPSVTVQFLPFDPEPLDVKLLTKSLRVETANQYAQSTVPRAAAS